MVPLEGGYCVEMPTPTLGHMPSLRHVFDSVPSLTIHSGATSGSTSFHVGFCGLDGRTKRCVNESRDTSNILHSSTMTLI